MSNPDEEILVQKLKSETEKNEGIELIIDIHGKSLFGFIRTYVHAEPDAEDLFQNTLIKISQKASTFKGNCSFKTWMWQIARNECLDFLRKQKRTQKNQAAYAENISTHPLSEESGFDGDKTLALLHQGVQSLPEVQRDVFVLRYFEEMSYREIAHMTGKSEGSLKASFFHASKKVSQFLTENIDG
ncbi:MAG: sigma-70 family RNA polymerase sigma factor [Saprospirales bacterium]|nr:MAG: sigma-70 family RNA polymerase sigma factor [Saprospirales bacterium]